MKVQVTVVLFLLLLVFAGCASQQSRDLASYCQDKGSVQYEEYFDDYELCNDY